MLISVEWLKDFVDVDLEPQALEDLLTALGLEAAIKSASYDFTGVVVGEVLDVKPVPESDHLSLCQVNNGEETVQIVCGAPNVAAGQKVPVAKVGAKLPGGFKIKKGKIRGQLSMGMICAEDELGLSDDHGGIMVLADNATIGQNFEEYHRAVSDVIIDLDLTPNRGDCFSHLGVARDVAAKLDLPLTIPMVEFDEGDTPVEQLAKVHISDPDGCHRYASRMIMGVKVGPSPDWLVRRLEAVGQRSINNIVDASNYVLMEMGHPLHIFDYDNLADHRIDVYFASEGQKFTTLDGEERKLGKHHLLIADGNGPVALAGVMGGLNSEVTGTTTNLLIESAYFAPSVIRKGAKSLDLSTEASKRFERDTDIDGLILALNRVTQLILEMAGGTAANGIIDNYPTPHSPKKVDLSVAFTNRLLGTHLTKDTVVDCLERLGIACEADGTDDLICTVPLNKPEITQDVDLIEEVARMVGYDSLPEVTGIDVRFDSLHADSHGFHNALRQILVPLGFNEHLGNTLINDKLAALFTTNQAVELKNSLSSEMDRLRALLLPGLMQVASFNERRQQRNLCLFEIGAVHHVDPSRYNKTAEQFNLGLVVATGKASSGVHWKKQEPRDYYFVKGVIRHLLESMGLSAITFAAGDRPDMVDVLEVRSGKTVLGVLGGVSQPAKVLVDLEGDIVVAELNLDLIGQLRTTGAIQYRDIVPYPVVERDIAMEVDINTPAGDMVAAAHEAGGKQLRDVKIFDLYSGKGIADNKKSLAFRFYFQSPERTLKDNEVDKQMNKITGKLEQRFNATWRKG